ncbi:MAG: PHP domain-containing protein, partial [Armatimonadota bacterium]
MRDDLDLHLHTAHVGCANQTMSVPALLAECAALEYTHIAITDHYNGPHHAEAQRAIREDLREYDGPLQITWGVELTIADAATGTLTADEETIARFGWEFVIAGPHGRYGETDPAAIIATQHRLMLATLRNPLVHALVHPWWFSRGEFAPGQHMAWMTDMSRIPQWHVEELGEVAVETGTAIEMNADAILHQETYRERFLED